jgi:hypothetical protein
MEAAAGFVWCLLIRVVVMGDAFGSKVMAGEIDQFPADLEGGKVEEMANRLNFCGRQCPMQPEHAVLKDITGLLPTAKIARSVENLSCESQ